MGGENTEWTLCYIPNRGQRNGYGCTGSGIYREAGVYERDVPMTSFWEYESILWPEGIRQMDLVIKDGSGSGHAYWRPDSEKFFPTRDAHRDGPGVSRIDVRLEPPSEGGSGDSLE